MILKEGASISGLHPVMRRVLRAAEIIWQQAGRDEGVTVTSGTDGVHSAPSWHHFGLALDFRTNYADHGLGDDLDKEEMADALKEALPEYDIVIHSTHIHIEVGNQLAKDIGVYF